MLMAPGCRCSNIESQGLTCLHQRSLTRHVNEVVEPTAAGRTAGDLGAARPARFGLQVPSEPSVGREGVPYSALPFNLDSFRREATGRGRYLTIVAQRLRCLLMRLRSRAISADTQAPDNDLMLLLAILTNQKDIRVFHQHPEIDRPETENIEPLAWKRSSLSGGGRRVLLPINRPGTYLVAFERDR